MASVGIAPTSGLKDPGGNVGAIDKLPDEMNDMKIREDKVSICGDSLLALLPLVACFDTVFYRKWKLLLLMVMEQRQVI